MRSSLADYRLTRSEKKALKSRIEGASRTMRDRLRHEAFDLARRELMSPDAVEISKWLEDTVRLLGPQPNPQQTQSEVLFSPEDNCVAKVCALLMQSRTSVDICVFTITDDRIATAINDAHRRKVKIRIITDDEKASDMGSDIFHLREMGIEVRTDRTPDHMHHKYALFDQQKVITGSYNWTRSASMRNEENVVVTNEQKLVARFANHFDILWKRYQ